MKDLVREGTQKQEQTYGSRYLFLVLLSDLGEVIFGSDLKSTDQSVPELTKPLEMCFANALVSCGHREEASHPRTKPAKYSVMNCKDGICSQSCICTGCESRHQCG